MKYITNEDEGWKVNITTKVETNEEAKEETIEKISWSRKKKIQVLSGLIVLVIAVCAGLIWHIKGMKDSDEDRFVRLVEAGAYEYAYEEYMTTDEDIEKYSEYIQDYFDELVNKYNETGDSELSNLIMRFDEVYGYKFDIDTSFFYLITESKQYYKYAMMSYGENSIVDAYDNFSCVKEEDTNYESARKYMKELREKARNSTATINVIYTNEQEKLVAEKLEEIFYLNNKPEEALYKIVFEYTQVTEKELEESLPEGEAGLIFYDNKSYYEYDMDTYGVSTEILVYNEKYFDDTEIKNLDSIINKGLPVQNIYIPLRKGSIISGMFSAYDSSIYSDYILMEDEWEYSEDYVISMSRNNIKAIMDYVRRLKNNPNVYIKDDGMEKFINGEIAAMIIQSDEYQQIRNELGEGYHTATLPYMLCEDAGTLEKEKKMQGVNKCKCIDFVYADDICNSAIEKLSSYIYESDFTSYLSKELGIYSESVTMLYSMEDDYITSIEQQITNNYNNVDYYNLWTRDRMDELAAFSVKAASREEIYEYADNIEWLDY